MDNQQRIAFKEEIARITATPRLAADEMTRGSLAELNGITHTRARGLLERRFKEKRLTRRWVQLENGKWAHAYKLVQL